MIKNFKLEEIKKLEKTRTKELQKEKELYGEVHTPFEFVDKILSLIPSKNFINPL